MLRIAGVVVLVWFGVQALRGRKRDAAERVEQVTGAVLLALAGRLALESR